MKRWEREDMRYETNARRSRYNAQQARHSERSEAEQGNNQHESGAHVVTENQEERKQHGGGHYNTSGKQGRRYEDGVKPSRTSYIPCAGTPGGNPPDPRTIFINGTAREFVAGEKRAEHKIPCNKDNERDSVSIIKRI